MFKLKLVKEVMIALFITAVIILSFLFNSGMESRFIYTDF